VVKVILQKAASSRSIVFARWRQCALR